MAALEMTCEFCGKREPYGGTVYVGVPLGTLMEMMWKKSGVYRTIVSNEEMGAYTLYLGEKCYRQFAIRENFANVTSYIPRIGFEVEYHKNVPASIIHKG